jgi:hypothetical protein
MRQTTRRLERRLGDRARAHLPEGLREFVMFVLKQGWASLFGGLLLIAILLSRAIWQDDWALSRNDGLFSLRWRRRRCSCGSGWRAWTRRG